MRNIFLIRCIIWSVAGPALPAYVTSDLQRLGDFAQILTEKGDEY